VFKALLLGLGVFSSVVASQMNAPPSQAAFHFAEIDEVMTSYGGNANVQFVEIKMLSAGQNFVTNSVLGAFDASGNFIGDVLIVPGDVTSGANRSWLMGTTTGPTNFQTESGLTPDFPMPAGLPTGGGMVCWGAPGFIVPPPGSWDHTNPNNYIDCVAYGTYSGPGNFKIGTTMGSFPAPDDADGHSLQRTQDTNSSANDWVCADPASPTNNTPASASLAATTLCASADTDGDGLSNDDETNIHGTDPNDADSDDDSLNDGDEVNIHGTDPLDPDSDDDGLCDAARVDNDGNGVDPADACISDEVNVQGTNPLLADTDGDGFNDGLEVFIGTDPLEACPNNSSNDALPFDTNIDKVVNLVDLVGSPDSFKISFGSSDGEPNYRPRFDWNGDLTVNLIDLVGVSASFKSSFGTSCGNGTVRIDETGDGPFELTSAEEFDFTFDETFTPSFTWRVQVTAADASNISFKVTCPGLDEHDFDIAHSGGTNTITCNDGSKVEITVS